MSLLSFLPEAAKEQLRRRAGAITPSLRMENLRRAGFCPKQIIDAGAFEGEWTQMAKRLFPDAEVLMIEPQLERAPILRAIAAKIPRVRFRSALLGAEERRARFLLEATNSRIIPDDWEPPAGSRIQETAIETLANIAGQEGFAACDFLKLDLQGHELPTLAGAGPIFGNCEVIWTEVSWLPIGNPPLVHEVIEHCIRKGYRLYDILGHNYRPLDGALWQTDLIFVRSASPLLGNSRWI